jgi:hypothetical protein
MAWWEGLGWEALQELRNRYPGLSYEQMAMEAMRHPSYADEFERLGAEIQTYEEHEKAVQAPGLIVVPYPPEDFPRPLVPKRNEQAFASLVAAALLAEETMSKPRPALPRGLKWFAHGKLQEAVRQFDSGKTRNDVAKKVGSKDATRVRNLIDGGLLPLSKERKLIVSPRVARQGGRFALRYLDESGEHWLDPHDEPPPPARGGSA